MKKIMIMCVVFMYVMINSCSAPISVIRGVYPVEKSIITESSFEDVWTKIIDFFAENNIPINTISKESGLIVANEVLFEGNIVTYEDAYGKIMNSNAWFVLPYAKTVVGGRATCSFNIRVKKVDDINTSIQINLNNIVGYYNIEMLNTLTFQKEIIRNTYPRDCQSTGVFEKTLLELFK